MKAHPGASLSILFAAVLASSAGPRPATAKEEVRSDWRRVFVERVTGAFRVGDQAAGSFNCIGWACRGALLGEPVHHAGPDLPSAGAIFAQARQSSERLNGKTIRVEHGAMALREMGAVQDYRMLHSSVAICEWLHQRGPVAAAVYWDDLLNVHRGALRPVPVNEGSVRGRRAHAITILGWSPSSNAFYFTPNLGRDWGKKGFALIREEDLQFVLINAVGFVHQGSDRPLDALGENHGETIPQGRSDSNQASSPGQRRILLKAALSRVEAVSRSLERDKFGARDSRR